MQRPKDRREHLLLPNQQNWRQAKADKKSHDWEIQLQEEDYRREREKRLNRSTRGTFRFPDSQQAVGPSISTVSLQQKHCE
jgi:hypothetical protein